MVLDDEQPQAGRYREFRQFNVESIGDEDPLVDAEVIAVLWRFLEDLGLKDLNLRELAATVPFIVLIVVMGLKPQPILDVLSPATTRYLARAAWASGEQTDTRRLKVYVRELPAAPLAVSDARPLPTQVLQGAELKPAADLAIPAQAGRPFIPRAIQAGSPTP